MQYFVKYLMESATKTCEKGNLKRIKCPFLKNNPKNGSILKTAPNHGPLVTQILHSALTAGIYY